MTRARATFYVISHSCHMYMSVCSLYVQETAVSRWRFNICKRENVRASSSCVCGDRNRCSQARHRCSRRRFDTGKAEATEVFLTSQIFNPKPFSNCRTIYSCVCGDRTRLAKASFANPSSSVFGFFPKRKQLKPV